jgi:hypothetical protein
VLDQEVFSVTGDGLVVKDENVVKMREPLIECIQSSLSILAISDHLRENVDIFGLSWFPNGEDILPKPEFIIVNF